MGMQLLALPFCLGPFSEFASHTTELLDTHTLQHADLVRKNIIWPDVFVSPE